jgi:hypothetical protein
MEHSLLNKGKEVLMSTISTPFGSIEALHGAEYYADGYVRSCIAAAESPLHTPFGRLIPQFTANTFRKRRQPVVSFHPNGMLRTLPLEEQTEIMTPMGKLPAELVTLYPDGALKRIFPLNGCLSGFWSQEDEARLARPLHLETPVGTIESTIISLYFGPLGDLRSLTFWPDEKIGILFRGEYLSVRTGIAFDDHGNLASVEPADPIAVQTPLGKLYVYDPDAIGITGDQNSLRFTASGEVESLRTVSHVFDLYRPGRMPNDVPMRVEPPIRCSPCDGESCEPAPLQVTFHDQEVTFQADGMEPVAALIQCVTAGRFHLPFQMFNSACSVGLSV